MGCSSSASQKRVHSAPHWVAAVACGALALSACSSQAPEALANVDPASPRAVVEPDNNRIDDIRAEVLAAVEEAPDVQASTETTTPLQAVTETTTPLQGLADTTEAPTTAAPETTTTTTAAPETTTTAAPETTTTAPAPADPTAAFQRPDEVAGAAAFESGPLTVDVPEGWVLNVRPGPGLEFDPIAELANRTTGVTASSSLGTWYFIELDGVAIGWAGAAFLSPS